MNKQKEERQIVLPGDAVGDKRSMAGPGTKKVGDRVVALTAGLLQQMGEKVSVLPVNGAYDPRPGDQVVGIVTEANTGNWIIDIKAPWLAPLHVSEVPWRVDFGETTSYLKTGDAILCKVLFVDESKKVQVTLKDRNLMKLEGGELIEVSPVKVARVIGKNGAMLNLMKGYLECWLHVGQNGRIWLNGDPAEVLAAKRIIQTIADEAHLPGLTERVTAMLEKVRPGGLDAGIVTERRTQRDAQAEAADREGAGPAAGDKARDGRAGEGDGERRDERPGRDGGDRRAEARDGGERRGGPDGRRDDRRDRDGGRRDDERGGRGRREDDRRGGDRERGRGRNDRDGPAEPRSANPE